MTGTRAATLAAVLQATSAAALGAWLASIVEPPAGVRWALLGLAVALAAAAAYFTRREGGRP